MKRYINPLLNAAVAVAEAAKEPCAVCGRPCRWEPADPDGPAPWKFGGWYCGECDTFNETDVEVED